MSRIDEISEKVFDACFEAEGTAGFYSHCRETLLIHMKAAVREAGRISAEEHGCDVSFEDCELYRRVVSHFEEEQRICPDCEESVTCKICMSCETHCHRKGQTHPPASRKGDE